MVALVDFPVEWVEHQAVRAVLLYGYAVDALVVLVALLRVLVLTVLFRAVVRAVYNALMNYVTITSII